MPEPFTSEFRRLKADIRGAQRAIEPFLQPKTVIDEHRELMENIYALNQTVPIVTEWRQQEQRMRDQMVPQYSRDELAAMNGQLAAARAAVGYASRIRG